LSVTKRHYRSRTRTRATTRQEKLDDKNAILVILKGNARIYGSPASVSMDCKKIVKQRFYMMLSFRSKIFLVHIIKQRLEGNNEVDRINILAFESNIDLAF